METYDFGGVATAYDVRCKDGRVIQTGAFDHQKGETVPIVWRHGHKDIRNVLGHAELSVGEVPPGMRVKARFNQSKEGQRAKQLVQDEDIKALSIWANELIEHETKEGRAVEKGRIREVSLVVTGMNPGARIDDVVRHSDDPDNPNWVEQDGIIIHTEHELELIVEEEEEEVEEEEEEVEEVVEHEDEEDEDETVNDIYKTLDEGQRKLFDVVIHAAGTGEKVPPNGSTEKGGPTLRTVFDSLDKKQRDVLYYMTGQVSQEEPVSQGDNDMAETHNIFEESGPQDKDIHLAHENLNAAMATAQKGRVSSLREAFRQNDVTIDSLLILAQEQPAFLSHSITNISNFFPNAKAVEPGGPQYLMNEPTAWVSIVLNGVRQVPWARLKSNYADLTGADARAKGYVTGAQKVEEVIVALQRETTPQTVYKLQKLDRDNIIDITEFDVVVWLKAEMRMMLQEEVARAILISDGRAAGAEKIVETNVRPIYNDDATYAINRLQDLVAAAATFTTFTASEFIDLVDYIAESFDDYRGAGSPVFFCQQTLLTKLLTIRDADNHRLHMNKADLADQLGVSAIVPVPVMNGMNRTDIVDPPGVPTGTYDIETLGVIVNLRDYAVGKDRGGEVNFFDDFDIDYNKFTYLYETRMSGALTNPKSAVVIENVVQKTA